MSKITSLKNSLLRLIRSDEYDNLSVSENDNAIFHVRLGQLLVGVLSFTGNEWVFEYSEDFKAQTDIVPLSNFPNKQKKYTSEVLFPFFATRIPSKAQRQANDDSEINIIRLLQEYGKRTISNPYTLSMA